MDIKLIFTRWPFRWKLLLLLLVAFLPAFGIIVAGGVSQRQNAIVKAQDDALLLVRSLAAQQEQIAIATKTMLSTLAQLNEVQNLNAPACNRIFHELHKQYPFYSSILAMTPEGDVFAAHSPLEPGKVNQSDRKYFRDAVSSLDFSAGEYIIGRVSKMTSLNYSFPVLDVQKKVVAVLTAGLNLNKFGDFISTAKLPKGSAVVFTDHKGVRLYRLPEHEASPMGKPVLKGYFDSISGGAAEGLFEWTALDGVKRINAFKQLRLRENSPPYLYMVVGLPKDIILHKANLNMLRNLLVLGLAALLALSLAWMLGNAVLIKPINRLVEATQQFGRGEMDIRTGLPHTPDELGRLAQSFDDMAALLEMRNREREKAKQELSKAYDGLEGIVKLRTAELVATNTDLQVEITERNQAEAKLARDARVNASIADLSRTLLSLLPIDKITALVSLHVKDLTDSARAFCGYINPQTGALVLPSIGQKACGVAEKTVVFHKFAGLWGWVLEHGQPLLTNNPSEDPRAAGTPPGHFPIQRFLSVPAIIDGKLVGQIGVANANRDYTLRDQELCERIAGLFAMAIHRHRLDETLRESESCLKTILDNVQTGVLIVDPETHVIVDANPVAIGLIGAPKEEVIGSECDRFICRPEHGKCAVTDLGKTVGNAERILQRLDGTTRWVMQTVVRVSLQGKKRLLESYVDITERRQWEDAIQTTNDKLHTLVAQVEERNRTMTLVNEMADMLQACQVSEEAYEAIGHFMPRYFSEDAGALYILNNSRNLFEPVVSWGQDPPAVPFFAPDECWSVRRGRLHKVENPQDTLCCPHVAESIPGGYLCVPLIALGETLGVIHLQPRPPVKAQPPALGAVKDQLALTMAEDLAMALANLRLREKLRSQAIRDPLTGLFNRRYLEETLERELNRVKRQGTSLGVIMMDLDHFKEYNDTFGHSAGDELLSALGILLKSQVRGEDIACRYGGEEFLLILPGASLEIALERAESLHQAVKEMHQHHQGLKPTSLSLGVAVYPDHGDTGGQLIRSADAALYQAKQGGRDRVVAAEYAEAPLLAEQPASIFHRLETS
jgi:diguanylate cyclase (GGDEF)-like protein/PAS domain S-box-containing protein